MPMITCAFPHPKVQANLKSSIDSDQSSVGFTIMEFFSCFTVNSAWVLSYFSCVRLFETLWTVAQQSPLSKGFSRQEYWSGCHVLLQGIFPTQGSNPCLLCLLHCRQIFYLWATGKAPLLIVFDINFWIVSLYTKGLSLPPFNIIYEEWWVLLNTFLVLINIVISFFYSMTLTLIFNEHFYYWTVHIFHKRACWTTLK